MLMICINLYLMDFSSGQINQIYKIKHIPRFTILLLLIMTSLVASFTEEISLRGCIQGVLENKFNPIVAILAVAAIFTLIHLPNFTISAVVTPWFFVGSLGWGILAHLANSVIPGMVIHFSVDLIGYLFIWKYIDLIENYSSPPPNNELRDYFIYLVALTVFFIMVLVYMFYLLNKKRNFFKGVAPL